jgi:hypothetical protein
VCPHCGTREEEWDADEEAYVAVATVCAGCEAIADRQADVDQNARGVKVSLHTPAGAAALKAKTALKAQAAAEERRRRKRERKAAAAAARQQ